MTTRLLLQVRSQGFRQITIPHECQSLLIRTRDTPTKIATHVSDHEYSQARLRVLAISIASTRQFDCEYSRVQLRVLASTIASTRVFVYKYSRVFSSLGLASFDSRGQGITRVHSLTIAFGTCVWYCEWYESLVLVCKLVAERHCIINIPLPEPTSCQKLVSKAFCLTVSITISATTRETGDPIAMPCTCWNGNGNCWTECLGDLSTKTSVLEEVCRWYTDSSKTRPDW